jgi:HK97 family phage major capsid protein
VLSATRKSEDAAAEAEATETKVPLIQEIEARYKGDFDEITETAKSLSDKIDEITSSGENADKDEVEKLTKQLADLDETQKSMQADRDRELVNAQVQELGTTAKSLREVITAAREPHSNFSLGSFPTDEEQDKAYGPGSEFSFFQDAAKAFKNEGGPEYDRWLEATTEKAMTQASGSTGGYLVPPEVSGELLKIREQSNILRPLFSQIQVNADVLRIAAQTSGLLAGWVAELAEKPESELSFGEISVNVFWKAGMAVVSNQLLRNSNPSIDSLIYNDLGRRLAALEEIAFISGSGTGQPLGLLHTPGVQYSGDGQSGGNAALTSTDPDDLLDAIVDAITAIHTEYFGAPNGILMHPRTWAYASSRTATPTARTRLARPPAASAVRSAARLTACPALGPEPDWPAVRLPGLHDPQHADQRWQQRQRGPRSSSETSRRASFWITPRSRSTPRSTSTSVPTRPSSAQRTRSASPPRATRRPSSPSVDRAWQASEVRLDHG